ncbi:hypothetical protein CGCF415_v007754 [Colletotrichum fructicola]|nr:hypothetical protein CGCFRS4_v005951 [Colletotrichum fructicola]KAF4906685.1 hypothetical protein CGCF415_v007754 [Colletotrichum fructicola]KAF4933662.1 hypothetical protein CGCF245_v009387 [Colletotrichum fructicola]
MVDMAGLATTGTWPSPTCVSHGWFTR